MSITQHVRRIGYFMCGLVLMGSLVGAAGVDAATYYVATTGNDANPGTQAAPFRTLNKGVSVLHAGDTLYVKSGTYAENLMNKIPGGTSWSSPVTVAAYPGNTVTIRPTGGSFVLSFSASSKRYIVVNGLILDAANVSANGIVINASNTSLGSAHHIRIINSEVKNAPRQGILVAYGSNSNEFINLKVHDNGTTDFDHGFYITSSNNLVEKSSIYRNAGFGVHVYNGSSGQSANNNIIRNNKTYENARVGDRGAGIILTSGSGNMAYNNLVWGNNGGIIVNFSTVSNTKVFNNVVYTNGSYGIYIGSGSTNTKVQNNIVYQNSGPAISNKGSGTLLSNNLIDIDPKFVNAAAADFRLKAGSPAINTGVTLSDVAKDYAGVSRPQGGSYDIGGYEYTGSTSSTPMTAPMNLRIAASK
jgi:hypothetical protein